MATATVEFKGGTVRLDPASGDEVYALARRRVDRDFAKGVVPSDENVESWLDLCLRGGAVEAAVDHAVGRLLAEQRVYAGGNADSYQRVVAARGLLTRHEHNNRRHAEDPHYAPAVETFRWSVGQ